MGRAFHDGLLSFQFHLGIEAVDEGEIAVAGEDGAQLRDAERAIHLGVTTTRDIEMEGALIAAQHFDFQRAIALPGGQGRREIAQASAALLLSHGGALLFGDGNDGFAQDFADTHLTEFGREAFQERLQDARLDLAPLQNAEMLVELVAGWVGRLHGGEYSRGP